MHNLTPREIVAELDKYIIRQDDAKKAVAIALRNRWRRRQVPEDLRDEIAPKNIIMIGPTGVGKTEIARRLARLADAPFLKVEASKFTEVGYVGRDVDSMIRDLTELAVKMVQDEEQERVKKKAEQATRERLLDLLVPPPPPGPPAYGEAALAEGTHPVQVVEDQTSTREKFRQMLKDGRLEDHFVEIEVSPRGFPTMQIFSGQGMEEMAINLQDMMSQLSGGGKTKHRRMKVSEAREMILEEEAQKLVDMEKVTQDALARVQELGIIFLDELDKIAGHSQGHGPDVSREGVQRDILPIVEGSTVMTKYGMVKSDHILFIAAGAFHMTKPSDLIPELQGRFPIRVELNNLTRADFQRILVDPENSLVKQYKALMETEGIVLDFLSDAIEIIAELAEQVNEGTENIGARRLHTIMEKLLEEISFMAPEMSGARVTIDAKYVKERLGDLVADQDLSRYIL